MKIERSNYELYVIDYLDGKLDAETVAALMIFLAANPDLQAEFDLLNSDASTLVSDSKSMPGREFLKKPEFSLLKKEFDRSLAAKLEGDLSPEQEAALDMNFVLYPQLHDEWALMQQSRVEPDMSVQYPNKSELKKRSFTVSFKLAYYSAAAVALIAVGLVFFRPQQSGEMALANAALHLNLKAPSAEVKQQVAAVQHIPATSRKIAIQSVKSAGSKRRIRIITTEAIAFQPAPVKINTELAKPRQIVMPPIPADPADKFYSIDQILTARLKQESKDALIEENAKEDEKKLELGAFALKVFNKVAGTALKLKKKYDGDGNVVGVGIASNDFEFYNGR